MKKLLITGASGFLGNRIADFYAKICEIIAPAHRELDITDKDNTALVLKIPAGCCNSLRSHV